MSKHGAAALCDKMDDWQCYSANFHDLGMEVANLSEVRRPGSGTISEVTYTFFIE